MSASSTQSVAGKKARAQLDDKALVVSSVEMEVPFQDVDPARLVWHGNYFRYFESARLALMRRVDLDYPKQEQAGYLLPLVDTRVRFVQPLTYGDRIRVRAGLLEWRYRIKIAYEIHKLASGQRVATAYTIQRAVDSSSWESPFLTPSCLIDGIEAIYRKHS